MVTSRKVTTTKSLNHTATFTAFARYCRETLLTPAAQVTPAGIVAWLMAVDGTARRRPHPGMRRHTASSQGTACTKQCQSSPPAARPGAAGSNVQQRLGALSEVLLPMVRHFVWLAAQANKAGDTLKERSGAALLSFLLNSVRLPGGSESLLQCGVTNRRWGDLLVRLVDMGPPARGGGGTHTD